MDNADEKPIGEPKEGKLALKSCVQSSMFGDSEHSRLINAVQLWGKRFTEYLVCRGPLEFYRSLKHTSYCN